eukprot:CAMPEP_0201283128 /NCGR_PEP_ID=MMETSP1317-20130820/7692_1 /ASSEMBLY_ACC=CAM_ASM_000770 /TAXON_ID=187299 /ORGANISM="Undescribed Undescribed, Strain Undescribed" /LENGTH=66 /DNA_ID=CAMNT_0047598291 /DNA_START=2167 /DNA_END=2367 /DNA_ORIENTATION=-
MFGEDEEIDLEEMEVDYDPFLVDISEIAAKAEAVLIGHAHIYLVGLHHLLDTELDFTPIINDKGEH